MMKHPKKKDDNSNQDKPFSNAKIKKIIASPYVLPPNILNILNEHTSAYLLFSLDFQGNLQLNVKADNQIVADGLKMNLLQMLIVDADMRVEEIEDDMQGTQELPPEEEV